jgi:excisionase family DNA binding protein
METITFEQLPSAVTQLSIKIENIERLLLENKKKLLSDQSEELLTIQEASKFLHLSVPTIYSKVSRGELPVMKRSKRLYFSRDELLQYVKEGRKKTIEEVEGQDLSDLIGKRGRRS